MAPSEQQHIKEEGNEVICNSNSCWSAALRCAAGSDNFACQWGPG